MWIETLRTGILYPGKVVFFSSGEQQQVLSKILMLGDCSCAEYCARSVAISACFERLNAKWERQHHGKFINNGDLLAFRGWNKKSRRCYILGNFATVYGCLFNYYLLFLAHRPPKNKVLLQQLKASNNWYVPSIFCRYCNALTVDPENSSHWRV